MVCLLTRIKGPDNILDIIILALIIGQATFVIFLCFLKIRRHKQKILLFASNVHEKDLKWLEQIIIALMALIIFIGFYNVFFSTEHLNTFANIFSLYIILFVSYHTFKQKEIFSINENERRLVIDQSEASPVEKKKILADKELYKLKDKLIRIMEKEQPYLDEELSLIKLAETMNLNPHQLSYLINEGFEENFFMFINKYRVEKVKELLLREDKKHLSVLGIAFESGFNSKTSFNTTFRKICGMTPTEFRKSKR